jgi:alpha-tubulin suppressor-like RCC1 family protein
VAERRWRQRWQRRTALALSLGGLCSACTLDWDRSNPADGDTALEDAGEPESPDEPGAGEDPPGSMDASASDPGDAETEQDPDTGTTQDPDASAEEAGLDDVVTTAASDAGSGPVEDTASDAATQDAALSTPDTGVSEMDAGCGQCGENQECNWSDRTCRCAPKYYSDGSRCVRDPCANFVCGKNQVCQRDANPPAAPSCVCAAPTEDCDGECVDMNRDRAHCGKCRHACAGSLACVEHACEQPVQQLILGPGQTCALRKGGAPGPRLSCWGENKWGFIRDINQEGLQRWELPRDVPDVPEARLMVLGQLHRCVVPAGSDVVRCWGLCLNECGATEYTSDMVLTDTPAENVVGLAAVSLRQGRSATCMLSASGVVRCMGWNPFVLDTVGHAKPVPITFKGEPLYFRDVHGGTEHFCGAVGQGDESARRAVCWGRNNWNQLGSPDAPPPGSPPTDAPAIYYVQKEGGGDLIKVVKTSTAGEQSCAVDDHGDVYCWGENGVGQLGHGDAEPHIGAVLVKGVHRVADVAVGGGHSCALTRDGEVSCWGHGFAAGQGDRQGDLSNGYYFSTAQAVPGLTGVVELRVGKGHTCVRLDTGAVKCWGTNDQGQLGDGTAIERAEPTLIPALL